MKPRPLWKLSVVGSLETEEMLGQALELIFGISPVSYTDFESGTVTVSVYLDRKPDWSRNRKAEVLKALGFAAASTISLQKLPALNWAESWKKHFKPLEIGSALLIKPSWSRQRPRKGQAVITLDPGLSFGTGQHPTTAFCLKQLAACRDPHQSQSCLDIGTGSGILAIAAAKLGYAPIHAFDSDADAVKIACANARVNRVLNKIQFSNKSLGQLPRRPFQGCSVVCANLISNLLLAERKRITAQTRPRGILVLAGILASEFRGIQAAYEALGMKLLTSQSEKEWRSGCFLGPG